MSPSEHPERIVCNESQAIRSAGSLKLHHGHPPVVLPQYVRMRIASLKSFVISASGVRCNSLNASQQIVTTPE